jgi:hypothetical protein
MKVVALAGRRIDAEDADVARFPLDQADQVKQRLDTLLRELRPDALVCSAACGADLLALEAAAALDIPATIVLPFEPALFRASSVVDRQGDWGARFDAVMARATADRIHVIESLDGEEDDAYAAATVTILDDAQKLAAQAAGEEARLVAVTVWDGVSRGDGDLTDYFRQHAARRGFEEREIRTQPGA